MSNRNYDKKIKVLVVDDHPIHRTGVISLLNVIDFIGLCSEASNGLEALNTIKTKKIDVILLDLDMPIMNGIKTIEAIHGLVWSKKKPKIIIMSVDDNKSTLLKCYNLGIDGFINKSSSLAELKQLFNLLKEDETYYSASVKNTLFKHLLDIDEPVKTELPVTSTIPLNDTEISLLRCVCLQYTIDELAAHMNRSIDSIKSIRYRLYKKIGVTNMIGALLYGIENKHITIKEIKSGLIQPQKKFE